jgi:hypothetical protein
MTAILPGLDDMVGSGQIAANWRPVLSFLYRFGSSAEAEKGMEFSQEP